MKSVVYRLLIYKENSTNCYFSCYLLGWETLVATITESDKVINSRAVDFTLKDGSEKEGIQPVPKLDLKDGDKLSMACVFYCPSTGKRIIKELNWTVTQADGQKVLSYKGNVEGMPRVKDDLYLMAFAGVKVSDNKLLIEGDTELKPCKINEPTKIEAPFATDWCKLEKDKTLGNYINTSMVMKPKGIFMIYKLANNMPLSVKIDRTFTVRTNTLVHKGAFDFSDTNALSTTKAPESFWIEEEPSENKNPKWHSDRQRLVNLGTQYRVKYKLLYDDNIKDASNLSAAADSKENTIYFSDANTTEHNQLGRYYVAWMMPQTVGYAYTFMLGNAEVTDVQRTTYTSELTDRSQNPNTLKPFMKNIAIGGTNISKWEQGKTYVMNMSIVRPMMTIERFVGEHSQGKLNFNQVKMYDELYYRAPKLSEMNAIFKNYFYLGMIGELPNNKDYNGMMVRKYGLGEHWGSYHNNEVYVKVNDDIEGMTTSYAMGPRQGETSEQKNMMYSLRYKGYNQGHDQLKQNNYTALYRYHLTRENNNDILDIKVRYLGPHILNGLANVNLYYLITQEFWETIDDNLTPEEAARNLYSFKLKLGSTYGPYWCADTNERHFYYMKKMNNKSWMDFDETTANDLYSGYVQPFMKTEAWGARVKVKQP